MNIDNLEKVVVEVNGVFFTPKPLTNEEKEHYKTQELIGKIALEDIPEEVYKEDFGIIQFFLIDIFMVNEAEKSEYSVVTLTSGTSFVCDVSTKELRKLREKHGYTFYELKGKS